jgi:hypothetical protein
MIRRPPARAQEISPEDASARRAEIGDARNVAERAVAEAGAIEEELAVAEERKVMAERGFSEARGALNAARSEVCAATPLPFLRLQCREGETLRCSAGRMKRCRCDASRLTPRGSAQVVRS